MPSLPPSSARRPPTAPAHRENKVVTSTVRESKIVVRESKLSKPLKESKVTATRGSHAESKIASPAESAKGDSVSLNEKNVTGAKKDVAPPPRPKSGTPAPPSLSAMAAVRAKSKSQRDAEKRHQAEVAANIATEAVHARLTSRLRRSVRTFSANRTRVAFSPRGHIVGNHVLVCVVGSL